MGKVEKMRRALMRSNTRLLLSGVLVFQLLAMALVAFKDETVSVQALVLAAGSGAAYVALKSDKILIKGDVEIEGNVKISDLLEADGIEMTTHTHTGDSGGSTSEPHRTEG